MQENPLFYFWPLAGCCTLVQYIPSHSPSHAMSSHTVSHTQLTSFSPSPSLLCSPFSFSLSAAGFSLPPRCMRQTLAYFFWVSAANNKVKQWSILYSRKLSLVQNVVEMWPDSSEESFVYRSQTISISHTFLAADYWSSTATLSYEALSQFGKVCT